MTSGKKKIKTLLKVLYYCENNINIKGYEQVENIINKIKNEKIKFIDLQKTTYFKAILDIVFSYYELNRDSDTENIYNYLLQLIETSVSTEE